MAEKKPAECTGCACATCKNAPVCTIYFPNCQQCRHYFGTPIGEPCHTPNCPGYEEVSR